MSLKKIAETVGVSMATVSRVLNKPDRDFVVACMEHMRFWCRFVFSNRKHITFIHEVSAYIFSFSGKDKQGNKNRRKNICQS